MRHCRLYTLQLAHCLELSLLGFSLPAGTACTATDMPFQCTLVTPAQKRAACRRDGEQHNQTFQRGVAAAPLASQRLPKGSAKRKGTEVRFLFDKQVFVKG